MASECSLKTTGRVPAQRLFPHLISPRRVLFKGYQTRRRLRASGAGSDVNHKSVQLVRPLPALAPVCFKHVVIQPVGASTVRLYDMACSINSELLHSGKATALGQSASTYGEEYV